VDAALQALAREFSFSQRCIDDIATPGIEACTNAIEHGNRFDPCKRVRVVLELDGDTLLARVMDEGPGFEWERYLERTEPPDPMSEKGRGIVIMKALADRVRFHYEDGVGLTVELAKTRHEGGREKD
jgi:serine/threonine-protein kinase RsbW